MSLPYVSPAQMNEYRQTVLLFAKGAPSLECIRSHYMPDRTGVCDLTRAKEQEELFVLANRAGNTMKVSAAAMQIIANILDIQGADEWYQKLKDQKKAYRERLALEAQKKEEERRSSARTVLVRKKSPNTVLKHQSS
ncbi:MAG: hypothetical protein JST16_06005 [Bdellovibrionales bacterium]|nr:hypothetical protein [Bdellovibrionales bacterium]